MPTPHAKVGTLASPFCNPPTPGTMPARGGNYVAMRLRIVLLAAVVACAPDPDARAPSSPPMESARASPDATLQPARTSCASVATLTTAKATTTSPPSGRPLPSPAPPGAYLFEKDPTTLQLYSGGRVDEFKLPMPIGDTRTRAVLDADGTSVRALLADVAAKQMSMWSSSGHLVPLEIPFSDFGVVEWSPNGLRLAVIPGLERATAIYLAGFDETASRFAPGGFVFGARWRGPSELTFMSASSRDYPIPGATLWSWRPSSQPRAIGTFDLGGWWAWRPDGAELAYPAVGASGTVEVRVRAIGDGSAPTERTVLTADQVLQAKQACDWAANEIRITFLEWHRTGLLAVGLRESGQYDYGVAVVGEDASLRGMVRSNDTCYIPFAQWADLTPLLVTFLYGPDCGQTELLNRALLVDQNGSVTREMTIARKGPLLLSSKATWAAMPGEHEVVVFRLNDPRQEFVIPLGGFVGWCCAE